jgi:hypothetical protein
MLDASFDSASKHISVRLEGVQGSTGMSEFTIPKEFMAGPFAVSLDGKLTQAEGMTVSQRTRPTQWSRWSMTMACRR